MYVPIFLKKIKKIFKNPLTDSKYYDILNKSQGKAQETLVNVADVVQW